MKTIIKTTLLLAIFSLTIISCGDSPKNNTKNSDNSKPIQMPGKDKAKAISNSNNYGEEVTVKGAADVGRVPSLMENIDEKQIKVIGKIDKVCQAEGCWIDIDMGNGDVMHVTFKDESFVVPKDIAGKTAIMDGIVTKEILPVDLLKKMAKDEGKSQEEINNITSPVIEYSFEATGVQVQ